MNMIYKLYLTNVLFLFYFRELHSVSSQMPADGPRFGWVAHCSMQPNGYTCSKNEFPDTRFYYDVRMQLCKTFEYGNCDTNLNKFHKLSDCANACKEAKHKEIPPGLPKEFLCSFQPDFGNCNFYIPLYYYDITQRRCMSFAYSGCGGNRNRFPDTQSCLEACSSVIKVTEVK